ncbi:hypothetical protein AOQ84DRAFT_307992 [Glonium stellatum]|uniref:Uncharacterized protein n=1 Tax=Glonium stellatum TaxID=574774 RepID=A0A8E2FDE7_9PEZI|nr:hypothetical protein AOQ84DRAFT_307992 [Glonium stellatum]
MRDGDALPEVDTSKPRFIVAVDFGTTFSSVSFVAIESHEQPQLIGGRRIRSIKNYPDDQSTDGGQAREVPTEIWYPNNSKFREAENLMLMESDKLVDEPSQDGEEHTSLTDEDNLSTEGNGEFLSGNSNSGGNYGNGCDKEKFLWGYKVHEKFRFPDAHQDKANRLISRFKLLLDKSEHTEIIRKYLEPTVQALKERKIIVKWENIITDYLTSLFRHVKEELYEEHSFTDDCAIEFVLCVPAIWTQEACRKMQSAMGSAMFKSGFRGSRDGNVEDLFIVSEPEAAAAYVLENNYEIKPGDTFVILDAGGGTIDATTYTVDKTEPLRLIREAVNPGGGLYGSSYLNETFREFLEDKLRDKTYLERGNTTIDGIIESLVTGDFENRLKRQINLADKRLSKKQITLLGLREDARKNLDNNRINIEREDWERIFRQCLRGASTVMTEQLELARAQGLQVNKVILIGGFAASPSLKWFLEKELHKLSEAYGSEIRLLRPETPGTAVASGAILRALNKEDGPARFIRSSYGFLRTEPYEPEVTPAHVGVKPSYDHLDGNQYIRDTIDWVVKKGELVEAGKVYEPLRMCHTFPVGQDQELVCREQLYVSDTSTESSYQRSHPKNKGAQLAGEIVLDMTFLRRENRIKIVQPARRKKGKKHYRVEFDLLIKVDGRNLRYMAKYPPGGEGEVLMEGQTCIAAAFLPGTN